MIKVMCVDDSNRPKEIPHSKWVEVGKWYTIIHVSKHTKQNGIKGVTLSEICLDESCAPYEAFRLDRFGFLPEDVSKFWEFAVSCTGLSEVNVKELLEDQLVELIDN
jgi:hypothetical protein